MWRCPRKHADDYQPSVVVIDLDIRDPANHAAIRDACLSEQAKFDGWRAGRARENRFDGSLKALSRLYQTHEASPYRAVKHNTRHLYDYELRLIETHVGARQINSLKAEDFIRWHRDAATGGALRKAQGLIKRLRAIISFGVIVEITACERVDRILSKMRFETPESRSATLTYEMAMAVIAKAHEMGRPSIALAQAIQFETSLRQTDVIGQYEPRPADSRSPYQTPTRQWVPGLVWQDIGDDLVLSLKTSKTGAKVTHSLGAMALVRAEIDRVPRERRVGPMIVSEATGMPYVESVFRRTWRKIAKAAGVPADVWNRDSRAGALSEGDEAGADLSKLQRMAGHTTAKMTSRYVRGRAAETSAEIAHLRAEKRSKEQ